MTLLIILFLLIIALVVYLLSSTFTHTNNSTKYTFENTLKNNNITYSIYDFQKGRSENFPFQKTPQILEINGEEIFIFSNESNSVANKQYDSLDTTNKKYSYVSNNVILFYKGSNESIIALLKNIVNQNKSKWDVPSKIDSRNLKLI